MMSEKTDEFEPSEVRTLERELANAILKSQYEAADELLGRLKAYELGYVERFERAYAKSKQFPWVHAYKQTCVSILLPQDYPPERVRRPRRRRR